MYFQENKNIETKNGSLFYLKKREGLKNNNKYISFIIWYYYNNTAHGFVDYYFNDELPVVLFFVHDSKLNTFFSTMI